MQQRLLMWSAGFILFGFLITSTAQATLIDRGNGLVYDDVNNISWIKDADVSGFGSWTAQLSWAAGFSLAGFDDFRQASIDELASLYSQLPGASGTDKTGNISPFENIQSVYWSGTALDSEQAFDFIFLTGSVSVDLTGSLGFAALYHGWAVRPGDSVTAVPEPSSLMLFGAGLVGLPVVRRKFRR